MGLERASACNMIKARYAVHHLNFIEPGGTSRGVLRTKETWYLILEQDGKKGIGECGLLRGLSFDDRPDYEAKLQWLCAHIDQDPLWLDEQLTTFPSIRMGLEMAMESINAEDPMLLRPSNFTDGKEGIPINGLIWMGTASQMKQRISEKLAAGFRCLKLKIGALDFEAELALIKAMRAEFSLNDLEIRVDANGAFAPEDALERLKRLSEFQLHSIEQPIKPGQWEEMAELCEQTPLPIALDEELIGLLDDQERMLDTIKPEYIILKPSFLGGLAVSDRWIQWARERQIGWWVTSALESNVGLNALAQYCAGLGVSMPQGLGTGQLFSNNVESPLEIDQAGLWYRPQKAWNFQAIDVTFM